MKNHWLTQLSALALLGAGILYAAVKTDYDHKADFAQYKTYSWLKVEAGDTIWADRISSAVDSQLAAKGWTKVPSGGDASVAAFGSTHNQKTLETFYTGLGGGWRWRGFGDGMATTTVENTPVGSVMVDVFDGHTQRLIWRGSGSDALSGKPDKNEKKLEKTVEEMFKHFPPPSRG